MCPLGCLGKKFFSKQIYTYIPKSENDVRLYATLARMNPTGLPVGAVSQDVNSQSSKAKKARELGTALISPEELEDMLKSNHVSLEENDHDENSC